MSYQISYLVGKYINYIILKIPQTSFSWKMQVGYVHQSWPASNAWYVYIFYWWCISYKPYFSQHTHKKKNLKNLQQDVMWRLYYISRMNKHVTRIYFIYVIEAVNLPWSLALSKLILYMI